jgi:tRNA pseudouridine55 synthase
LNSPVAIDVKDPRARIQRRAVHGVLLLDKPLGLSSNQALQKVKWLMRAEKAGHTGTLDPLASGVLPICLGAATKFSQLHLDADKSYRATVRLGVMTSTGDAEGNILSERPVVVDAAKLRSVQQHFTGPLLQVPPMHSALKKDGKALYEYAREGEVVEREPRPIIVHDLSLRLLPFDGRHPELDLEVRCSKGTYIRTLGEDIGEALGCGAHLTSLRRTASGHFTLSQCISLEQLESMDEAQRQSQLLPIETLLPQHHRVELSPLESARFLSGLRRRGTWPDWEHVAVYGQEPHALLGTAHTKAGELIPDRLLSPLEIKTLLESLA